MSSTQSRLIELRLEHLSRQLDVEKSKMDKLNQEMEGQRMITRKLEDDMENIKQQKSELALQLSLARQENSELKLRENYQTTQIKKLENEILQLEVQKAKQERQLVEKNEEIEKILNQHRDVLFEKERQLTAKQRELNSLRGQNIELQRAAISERDAHRQRLVRLDTEAKRLRQDTDVARKQFSDIRQTFLKNLQEMRAQYQKSVMTMLSKINDLQKVIREKQALTVENNQLRKNIEDLVTENSRMVIDLYNSKA